MLIELNKVGKSLSGHALKKSIIKSLTREKYRRCPYES